MIVEYDPESAILEESNAFDSELEGLPGWFTWMSHWQTTIGSPNRGARRYKIARFDNIEGPDAW